MQKLQYLSLLSLRYYKNNAERQSFSSAYLGFILEL